jgi:hypothetical protein
VLISNRDLKFVSGFWETLYWRRLGTRLNMSSSRHPETGGLTERVKNTFQRLLRCLCCYDRSNWTYLLPLVEFAYIASRALLGIEHSSFEANLGLYPEEPPDLLFNMRPSIPVSLDASEHLRLLHEVHALVRSVHKDDMETRSQPLTTTHFVRGNKVLVVTTSIFLRGQPNMKLRDR